MIIGTLLAVLWLWYVDLNHLNDVGLNSILTTESTIYWTWPNLERNNYFGRPSLLTTVYVQIAEAPLSNFAVFFHIHISVFTTFLFEHYFFRGAVLRPIFQNFANRKTWQFCFFLCFKTRAGQIKWTYSCLSFFVTWLPNDALSFRNTKEIGKK